MLKYVILASAMTIAAPVLAQQTTAVPDQANSAATTTGNPSASASSAAAQGAVPAQTDSSGTAAAATDTAQSATPGQSGVQTAPAQTAETPAQPQAATGSQVAQVVNSEFPTYDKDGNGQLSEAEFASWMVALKQASDPSAKPGDPATTKWADAAFAQADKDKSKSVSKDELTGFLSQGAS